MSPSLLYELIGYAGSALVVVSIMQRSIFKLRSIGAVGSFVFLVYSLLIDAYPIAVVNVIAGSIHLFHLRSLVRRKAEVFSVLRVRPESELLRHFLTFHRDEIRKGFHPEFRYDPTAPVITSFILRDVVPAGIFIGLKHPDHSIEILLDFVVPQYRDFKIGTYLYSIHARLFFDRALTQVWDEADSDEYLAYLQRMGFRHDPRPGLPGRYALDLAPITASRRDD